jgi:hypothetical protein
MTRKQRQCLVLALASGRGRLVAMSGKHKTPNELTGAAAARRCAVHFGDGHPACRLVDEIASFYGDSLILREDPRLRNSSFELGAVADKVEVRRVLIRLQVGAGLTRESLAHELLHLSLHARGFPFNVRNKSTGTIPNAASPQNMWSTIGQIVSGWVNYFDHEIFFKDFVDLGFDATKFAHPSPEPLIDGRGVDNDVEAFGVVSFAASCMGIMGRRQCWEQIGHEKSREWADDLLRRSSVIHPGLADATERISRLVKGSDVKNPSKFPEAFAELLAILGLPIQIGWRRFRPSRPGRFAASDIEIDWR